MEILKTNLEDFKNIENWEYEENFCTVNSVSYTHLTLPTIVGV